MKQAGRVPEKCLCLFFAVGFLFVISGCSSNQGKKPVKHTITIELMKFRPDSLAVSPGDTVVWINMDIVAHNVTRLPDSSWHSPTLQKGDSWALIVQAGSAYFWSIHQVMKGKLVLR